MKQLLFTCCTVFVLLCAKTASAQVYLSEDFESTTDFSLPIGWSTNIPSNDTLGWRCGTAEAMSTGEYPLFRSHTKFAGVNDANYNPTTNTDVRIQSPAFSIPAGSSPYIKFDCYHVGRVGSFPNEIATLEVSTDGGATWITYDTLDTARLYWREIIISLAPFAGTSNMKIGIKYTDFGTRAFGIGIDNVVVYQPYNKDIALLNIAPQPYTVAAYGAFGSNKIISGEVKNYGLSAITTYNVNYRFNGGSVVSVPISASIAPFNTHSFTLSTSPITLPGVVGDFPLDVWATVTDDGDFNNDTVSQHFLSTYSFAPKKRILYEEATGTWCGWCVRGMVYMDSMRKMKGNDVSLVAVHGGDPMQNTDYSSWLDRKVAGYPGVRADRGTLIDPLQMFDYQNAHENDFAFADIQLSSNIVGSTLTVPVKVKPAVDLSGRCSIALILTEYDVKGTGSAWAQVNYYSGGADGSMAINGVDYATLPEVVPASQMHYDHVARKIVPSPLGDSTILPAIMLHDSTYTINISTTIPASYNKDKMKAVVALIDNQTGDILNSANVNLGTGLSVSNINKVLTGVVVSPNPAIDNIMLSFSLSHQEDIVISILDMAGKVCVKQIANGNEGNNQVALSTKDIASGCYLVCIQSGIEQHVVKLSIIK